MSGRRRKARKTSNPSASHRGGCPRERVRWEGASLETKWTSTGPGSPGTARARARVCQRLGSPLFQSSQQPCGRFRFAAEKTEAHVLSPSLARPSVRLIRRGGGKTLLAAGAEGALDLGDPVTRSSVPGWRQRPLSRGLLFTPRVAWSSHDPPSELQPIVHLSPGNIHAVSMQTLQV